MTDLLLYIGIGLAVGAIIGWLIVSLKNARDATGGADSELQAEAMSLKKMLEDVKEQLGKKDIELAEARDKQSEELEKRAAAEAKLQEAQKNIEEQKKLLDEATSKLTDTFKALSLDALKSNNQSFLELAKKSLEAQAAEMKGDFGKRQEAVAALVKPLAEALKNYEEHVKSIESSRLKAYTSLEEHIKTLGESNLLLRKETDNLVGALRKPHVRGKWGEFTLRRTAELAGMVDRCDFYEQESTDTEEGKQRPDMIVNLPSGRRVIVDAKAPLDAYLDMIEATDESVRSAELQRHARQIKTHMKQLSKKEYWNQFDFTPEFVVMFLPGESFLSAALESDRELLEEGFRRKVIIATPTTLVALLKAVAYGWRQEKMAEHAHAISELGKELYGRICTFVGHLEKVRSGLQRATESYNSAIGSMERMVLPSARKFKELGATTEKDIPLQEPLDTGLRSIDVPVDDVD